VSIRVLVADDSEIMRATIGRVLEEDSRTEVVGEVGTFAETVRPYKINLYRRLLPVNMQRCSYQAHSGLAILRRETNEKCTPHSPTIPCEPK
jgi:chemotaxis response regulator CheB